jgi:hypothetical protein
MTASTNLVDVTFEHGHVFVAGRDRGLGSVGADWIICSRCGIIRRRDGQNKPCRGRVRVELRDGKEL